MAYMSKSEELDSLKMYMKEIQQYPLLSEQETERLINDYSNGDIGAKKKIVNSNQRLVVSIAKRYIGVTDSMEFLDLIQEGNIGLTKCIESYDSTIATFSTYAYSYIEGYIKNSINVSDKMIRRPCYLVEIILKYDKFIEEYEEKYSAFPTDKEIQENLDISDETLLFLKNKDIYDVGSYNKKTLSENGGLNNDEPLDFFADPINQYDNLINNMNDFDILNVIKDVLTDAEYYIFYYRVLANSSEIRTLQDIADEFNVSRQRIDQRISKIKQKIKGYAIPGSYSFSRRLEMIKSIFKDEYYKLDARPVEPEHLCLFKYLKSSLDHIELKMLYIILLYKVNYNSEDMAKLLKIDEKVVQEKYNYLINLLYATKNSFEFNEYKTKMLEQYGYDLYKQETLSLEESDEIRRLLK